MKYIEYRADADHTLAKEMFQLIHNNALADGNNQCWRKWIASNDTHETMVISYSVGATRAPKCDYCDI